MTFPFAPINGYTFQWKKGVIFAPFLKNQMTTTNHAVNAFYNAEKKRTHEMKDAAKESAQQQ